MQRQFFNVCTALGVVGIAGTAMAGDTTRFDVSFSDVDIFPADFAAGEVPSNAQSTDTADPGRYLAAFGWSNVDVDVCWNAGTAYSGWASEVNFAIQVEEAGVVGWYYAGSPFAGDNTGADVEDTCSNRQALAEVQTNLLPFTYRVDSATGLVGTGMVSTWGDGTGLRHSFCNTADFFFVLDGPIPAGCDGATGSCGEAHATPGCEDISCCALTCDINAGGDSFCCDVEWDSTCVDLAVALCGIYQYTCDAPAYDNDCVAGAIMLANGDTVAFDTTGANTDGPDQAECGSAYEDLPIWSDLWYMVEVAGDGSDVDLTATCCNTAYFDTKIAIYDAGAIGAGFDPATLPDVFVTCNEDCGNDAGIYYTSEASAILASDRQYLVRVGGYLQEVGTGNLTVSWDEAEPPLPAPECLEPGTTVVSQFLNSPFETPLGGGTWCGPGAANVTCRVYPASMFGGAFDVSCVDFIYASQLIDNWVRGEVRMSRTSSANPNDPFTETLAIAEFGFYQPDNGFFAFLGSTSFPDGPVTVDLAADEYLVVELISFGNPTGYTGYYGVPFSETDGTEGYFTCSTEPGTYTVMSEIVFGDGSTAVNNQPYIILNGEPAASNPCPADFNGDGQVNGADFGSLLAAWGACAGCPEDLNGDGQVNGADVGGVLAAWGACP